MMSLSGFGTFFNLSYLKKKKETEKVGIQNVILPIELHLLQI